MAPLRIGKFLDQFPSHWTGLAGVLLLGGIGCLDYVAGRRMGIYVSMSLSLFYVLPIALVAAKVGRRSGLIMSVAGTLALGLVEASVRPPDLPVPILALSVTLRWIFFMLIVVGLTALQEESRQQRALIQTERMRSSILSSVSHDLRTPLAAITGAASTILEANDKLTEAGRRELMETIYEEADRLSVQVHNLLEMTRLESGSLRIRKDLQPLEESVGAACRRLERQLAGRPLSIAVAAELPMVPADGVLLELVFFNLLENAVKYTPPGSPLEITARRSDGSVLVEVADRGPGLGEDELQHVFEKFYRGKKHGARGGAGLGLAICKGIILAHGGQIRAGNRPGGGAVFSFSLPAEAPGDRGNVPGAGPE